MQLNRILPFLRAFETVARLGQVRSAALEMNLTAGAVSHQIKMLEHHVGAELFVREKRRLTLSMRGRAFHHTVAEALRDLQKGLAAIAPAAGETAQDNLAVAAASGFAHIWLAPRLPTIAKEIGISNFATDIAREVNQIDWRRTDVAVVYDQPPWPGYHWEPFPSLNLAPLCSPALLNAAPIRQPRDLIGHMLLHEDSGDEWRRWLNAAEVVLPARKNAYFNRLSMAFNAALAGRGVALVSDFLARQYLAAGSLVRPIELSVPASKQYYIVTPASRRRELLIARFFDVTLEYSRMEGSGPSGLVP